MISEIVRGLCELMFVGAMCYMLIKSVNDNSKKD